MLCEVVKSDLFQIVMPNSILEKVGNPKEMEIDINKNYIILKPLKVREGWSEAFQKMAKNGDDKLIIDDKIDLDII